MNRKFFLLMTLLLTTIGFAVVMVSGQGRTAEDFEIEQKPEQIPDGDVTDLQPVVDSTESLNGMPSCRYGIADLSQTPHEWMQFLGTGWYLDFNAYRTNYPDVQYTPIIRVKQHRDDDGNALSPRDYDIFPSLDALRAGAIAAPGRLYLVGNEVDRIGQDGTEPDLYAKAYKEIYDVIIEADPTAQFAISGLVQVTPNRLRYLDLVWASYQTQFGHTMPVDVWNAHVYVLPEIQRNGTPNGIANVAVGTNAFGAIKGSGGDPLFCGDPNDDTYCYAEHDDMDIFAQQITAMRQWMKNHGQRNKPLIISEYSQLYPYEIDPQGCFLQDEYGQCFDPPRVTNFMKESHSWMETAADPSLGFPGDDNKLVQQWLWFGTYAETVGNSSNLYKEEPETFGSPNNGLLTQMGLAFKTAATTGELRPNLTPFNITTQRQPNGDLVLNVSVRNKGDSHITAPFVVTFYRNAGLTQPIGSVTVNPTVVGCAQQLYTYSVTWTNAPDGVSSLWVKIDDSNLINESNENDNVLSGQAVVGHVLNLPTIRR